MTEDQLSMLIRKYLSGEATEEEKDMVEQWYESFDAASFEFTTPDLDEKSESEARSLRAVMERIALSRVNQKALYPQTKRSMLYRWLAAAAVAGLLLVPGYLYFISRPAMQESVSITHQGPKKDLRNDIPPGGNKAVLTLGNGKQIILNGANNGLLSMQGRTQVIKVNNGLLTYARQSPAGEDRSRVAYNTVATPRGGCYEVVLPDGSKVWLNALSSIRFPTAFTGTERKVRITGEAYFEIAGNAARPFEVSVGKMVVKVLGTHFNIMAYDDEALIKTTLLEGAISVAAGDKVLLLKPGWQAQMNGKGGISLAKNLNVNEAVAWKNGLFWFDRDDIRTVMRQLSRWYNVDIDIRGEINDRFTGSIPRNIRFSEVFELLQRTGSIHYKIENNRIIVSP